jgi:hypothetical protein
MSGPVCLLVCTGKDCRRDAGFDEIVELAAEVGEVREVPCQDICKGPVVGIGIGDDVRWYTRVRKRRMRAAVLRSLRRGGFDGALADHEARKRRNEIRKAGTARKLRVA